MPKDNFELNENQSSESVAAVNNITALLGEGSIKLSSGKPSRKKSNSDYIRLDVANYKSYLQSMAAYDSMKNGRTISVTRYIQNLIESDMQARREDYEKSKHL